MRICSIVMATLLLSGSLAFAQVCPASPGSVCLVPSRTQTTVSSAYVTPSTSLLTPATVPYTASTVCPMPMGATVPSYPMSMGMTAYPMYGMSTGCPMSMGNVGMMSTCPTTGMAMGSMAASCPMMGMAPSSYSNVSAYQTTVSSDTACVLNAISGLRSDIRALNGTVTAAALQVRGQALISRMNQLMNQEIAFRQQLAANPNMPGAQIIANQLTNEANALNQDIAAFNTELSMVPTDQRPFITAQLNTFDVAYWTPALQRFASYRSQFPQSGSVYQTASVSNPWLTTWQSSYQTAINNIATSPQVYASAYWWSSTRVLGSTETFPAGSMMTLPSGAVIYIPASSAASMGMTSVCPVVTPVAPVAPVAPSVTTGVLGTTETLPQGTTTMPVTPESTPGMGTTQY